VAQCQEDANTLNSCINDSTEHLGRKVRINVWHRPKQLETLIPPPMSPEEVFSLFVDVCLYADNDPGR
jgi:hypothetical protein